MTRLRFFLPLAAACFLFQGCDLFGNDTDKQVQALTEPLWLLDRVEDADGRPMVDMKPGEVYRISFEADGKGSGVDACNA